MDTQPEQRLLALVPVAAALDLLHSGAATGWQPVIHCDVKPTNILVRTGDTVLVDLGTVRRLAGGHGRASRLEPPAALPKVLADRRYGSAADRYSLGAVAYFLRRGEDVHPRLARHGDVRTPRRGVTVATNRRLVAASKRRITHTVSIVGW